jgi:hypothetical protein
MESQVRASTSTGQGDGFADRHRVAGALRRLTAGGTDGNEQLTVLTGLVLIILLAALGITIIRIGQLIWLHLFLGLVVIGPVALKMASTGYRFVRYYSADRQYRAKGPPPTLLRMLGPLEVLLTVLVLVTGVLLLVIGPRSGSRSELVMIHKVGFIVWIVVTAIHVVGHLPEIARSLRLGRAWRADVLALRSEATSGPLPERDLPGAAGRWLSLAAALVCGLVLAVALIPQFSGWSGAHAFVHHHPFH